MDATKEQFIKALLHLRDTGQFRGTKYKAMLKAQYAAEGHTITAANMAAAVEYKSHRASNQKYGTLAKEFANFLEYTPPPREGGEPVWQETISTGNFDEAMDADFEFTMREQLVAAMEEIRWVP